MAELRHLRDHQGVEEPALRCRAPPEGRGEPESTPLGMDGPGGPRNGPPGRDSGGLARLGADMAGFPGRGLVLRVADAEANNWLPRALRTAPTNWRYRPRNPPSLQPQPPRKRRRRWRPRPAAMVRRPAGRTSNPRQQRRGGGSRPTARGSPRAGPGPPTLSAPPNLLPSSQQEDKRHPWLGRRRAPRARGSTRHGSPTDLQSADH